MAIVAVHGFVLLTVGSFSIYFAGRAQSLNAIGEEAHQTPQKVESRLQRITTLTQAHDALREAWQLQQSHWDTIDLVINSFSEGMQALLAVPLMTLGFALHALWESRAAETSTKLGQGE